MFADFAIGLMSLLQHDLAAQDRALGRLVGLAEGDDVRVTTAYGSIAVLAHLDDAQPASTLRVPHGWWKPETAGGVEAGLSSALLHNDGMLFPDDAWNLDPEQGLPNLRGGIFARIERHHE